MYEYILKCLSILREATHDNVSPVEIANRHRGDRVEPVTPQELESAIQEIGDAVFLAMMFEELGETDN